VSTGYIGVWPGMPYFTKSRIIATRDAFKDPMQAPRVYGDVGPAVQGLQQRIPPAEWAKKLIFVHHEIELPQWVEDSPLGTVEFLGNEYYTSRILPGTSTRN